MANISESSSYTFSQSKANKLTRADFERALGMPLPDTNKGSRVSKSPTEKAHQLGMFYSHISSRKIKILIKFGIANCEDDGGGEDKGLIIVDFSLPVAEVKKKIEARRNLTPGTYTMEYFVLGMWSRLENDIDWHACLLFHKGKKFIELRGLMRPPVPFG